MIDDFAESEVNDACEIGRRIRMGRISDISASVRSLSAAGHMDLVLGKSDFSAAYRGFPVLESNLGLSSVLVRKADGSLHVSAQLAMPFGSVAAVYAWNRVGQRSLPSSLSSLIFRSVAMWMTCFGSTSLRSPPRQGPCFWSWSLSLASPWRSTRHQFLLGRWTSWGSRSLCKHPRP